MITKRQLIRLLSDKIDLKKKSHYYRQRGYKEDKKRNVPGSYNYVHFIISARNV